MAVTVTNSINRKKLLIKCLTNFNLFGLLGWLGVAMFVLLFKEGLTDFETFIVLLIYSTLPQS